MYRYIYTCFTIRTIRYMHIHKYVYAYTRVV